MAFVDTFDLTKPLEEQLDFPITAHGLELTLDDDKSGLVTPGSIGLFPIETKYLALLMTYGFVDVDEFLSTVHDGAFDELIVDNHIGSLRGKLGADFIKSRSGKGRSKGFYLGDLAEHRKEHQIEYNGFLLNHFTGSFIIKDGESVILTHNEVQIMRGIFDGGESANRLRLVAGLYSGSGRFRMDSLNTAVRNLNKKLGGIYVTIDDGYLKLSETKS